MPIKRSRAGYAVRQFHNAYSQPFAESYRRQLCLLALVQAWHEAGVSFSNRERAALAWGNSVTRLADSHVPDEHVQLAAAVFSEKEHGT